MKKTCIIWRRFGKEHGESTGFKINPPEVVEAHLQQKIETFRQTPQTDWRWWQFSETLLVEKGEGREIPPTVYYYLPREHWLIVENIQLPDLDPKWFWYIHIGDMAWCPNKTCWIFTDLFADVLVQKNNRIHTVLDLDDLGHALTMGLITSRQAAHILTHTQHLIDCLQSGTFPPAEIDTCRKALAKSGCI